jgi:hypothetical protein
MKIKNIILTLAIILLAASTLQGVLSADWGYETEMFGEFEMDVPFEDYDSFTFLDLDNERQYTSTFSSTEVHIYYISEGADTTWIDDVLARGEKVSESKYKNESFAQNMTFYKIGTGDHVQYFAVYEDSDMMITIQHKNLDELNKMVISLKPWAVNGGIDFAGAKH